jgi:hypothetical protein
MITDNFDILGESIDPTKADSPSIIDANAVLSRAITLERL